VGADYKLRALYRDGLMVEAPREWLLPNNKTTAVFSSSIHIRPRKQLGSSSVESCCCSLVNYNCFFFAFANRRPA
jgi:hypothetical protein